MQEKTTTSALKSMVMGAYDFQNLRLMSGSRLCANLRAKLGLKESDPEKSDEEASNFLDLIRQEYTKLTDGIKKISPKMKFKSDGIISSFAELSLVDSYMKLEEQEKKIFADIKKVLVDFPIYTEFLEKVAGCGTAMSAIIIAKFDPHKARHVSGFWKYAGYDVCGDGKGRSRRTEHQIKVPYKKKDGTEAEKNSITFNPWLKSKLFVLGTCLIKAGGEYKTIYDNYKHRLENRPDWAERSKGHRHNAAIRYMVKIFLEKLWLKWRELEGLEVTRPYYEAKLGMAPHGTDPSVSS